MSEFSMYSSLFAGWMSLIIGHYEAAFYFLGQALLFAYCRAHETGDKGGAG